MLVKDIMELANDKSLKDTPIKEMVLEEIAWMSELWPLAFLTEKSLKETLFPPWMLIRIADWKTESSSGLSNSKLTLAKLTEDVYAI